MYACYHDGMRFALGVATVERLDGEVEGRRCELIDYTEKIVYQGQKKKRGFKTKFGG